MNNPLVLAPAKTKVKYFRSFQRGNHVRDHAESFGVSARAESRDASKAAMRSSSGFGSGEFTGDLRRVSIVAVHA